MKILRKNMESENEKELLSRQKTEKEIQNQMC